jgi:hypothetical protein
MIGGIDWVGDAVVVAARPRSHGSRCSRCGRVFTRVHSRYRRWVGWSPCCGATSRAVLDGATVLLRPPATARYLSSPRALARGFHRGSESRACRRAPAGAVRLTEAIVAVHRVAAWASVAQTSDAMNHTTNNGLRPAEPCRTRPRARPRDRKDSRAWRYLAKTSRLAESNPRSTP